MILSIYTSYGGMAMKIKTKGAIKSHFCGEVKPPLWAPQGSEDVDLRPGSPGLVAAEQCPRHW